MTTINEQLCDAAEKGDLAEVKRLLAAGANPNARRRPKLSSSFGRGLGQTDKQWRDQERKRREAAEKEGTNTATVLHCAVRNSDAIDSQVPAEIVRVLLSAGADPNALAFDGYDDTPGPWDRMETALDIVNQKLRSIACESGYDTIHTLLSAAMAK